MKPQLTLGIRGELVPGPAMYTKILWMLPSYNCFPYPQFRIREFNQPGIVHDPRLVESREAETVDTEGQL